MSKLTVTFKEVDFSYESEKILESFNHKVIDGEFISIIGPSGSGKSTFFRLITGLMVVYTLVMVFSDRRVEV